MEWHVHSQRCPGIAHAHSSTENVPCENIKQSSGVRASLEAYCRRSISHSFSLGLPVMGMGSRLALRRGADDVNFKGIIMKRLILASLLLLPTVASAQAGPGMGGGRGQGRGMGWGRAGFAPDLHTITGTISEKTSENCALGSGPLSSTAVCVTVDTKEKGRVKLHLGPSAFVHPEKLEQGKEVKFEIFETKMGVEQQQHLVKSYYVGDSHIILRDDKMRPAWRGWRRGKGAPSNLR